LHFEFDDDAVSVHEVVAGMWNALCFCLRLVKKKKASKKLLLKNEKVRNLTPTELEKAAGGAGYYDYTTAAVSGGATQPGPSHTDPPGSYIGIGANILIGGGG
jgi:hypothetical protein